MTAIHVNDKTFASEVLTTAETVLVDFHAPWCGPCRIMSGVVDDVAAELGDRGRVVKVNIDEAPKAASDYRVQTIPAFVVIKDGEIKEQFVGVVPKERLLSALERQLPEPA